MQLTGKSAEGNPYSEELTGIKNANVRDGCIYAQNSYSASIGFTIENHVESTNSTNFEDSISKVIEESMSNPSSNDSTDTWDSSFMKDLTTTNEKHSENNWNNESNSSYTIGISDSTENGTNWSDSTTNGVLHLNGLISPDRYELRSMQSGVIFKSDNAREYRNKKIVEFCENNGIYKVYSPPYNPENNGMAERFNQTLISCAKTLLAWSKLSENFWDYAILYANYLYNKTPHQIASNNIPDESYYKHKVKLDHLKTFGCITYYKNFDQNKGKFQPNSNKGIFLGFSEETNSYLIMDYNDFKMHNVREIVCLEDEPVNISLSNSVVNNNEYPSLFKFDFNFSKYQKINNDFFIINNQNKNQINDKNQENSSSPNNSKDMNNLYNKIGNNLQNNKERSSNNTTDISNVEDNIKNTSENDEEFYSADEEYENNFIENKNEKNFNNKNLINFEPKIQDKIINNENNNFTEIENLINNPETQNTNISNSESELNNNLNSNNKIILNSNNVILNPNNNNLSYNSDNNNLKINNSNLNINENNLNISNYSNQNNFNLNNNNENINNLNSDNLKTIEIIII
eukprot:jgi/Orpsp1_1/1174109/evm.model.c7180000048956.1